MSQPPKSSQKYANLNLNAALGSKPVGAPGGATLTKGGVLLLSKVRAACDTSNKRL